jgi:hypothetical protein
VSVARPRIVDGNTQVSVDKFSGVGYGVLYSTYINLYPNLIAHWKFEGDGTDEKGTYDMTVQNGPVSYVAGKVGQAVDLEKDSSQFFDLDNPPDTLDYPAAWSVSFWFKSESKTSMAGIVGDPAEGSGEGSIVHYDNHLAAREKNADGSELMETAIDFVNGRWYHGVVTYDSADTTGRIWLDGNYWEGDSSWDGLDKIYRIGASTWCWDGLLDEVMVFDKELTQAEVLHLYAEGNGTDVLNNYVDRKIDLTDALVAYWLLNESTGTNVPDTTGTNTGTTQNMGNEDWVSGVFGNALDFDGSNDYVDCGNDASLTGLTAWSVSMWCDPTDDGSTHQMFGWAADTHPAFLLDVWNNRPALYMSATNYMFWPASAWTTLAAGGWHHMVVICPGNGQQDVLFAKLYVDGTMQNVSRANMTVAGTQDSKGTFSIGAQSDGGYGALTKIDDVRVYNRALSPEEVLFLYKRETADSQDHANLNIHDSTKPSETHFTRSGQ